MGIRLALPGTLHNLIFFTEPTLPKQGTQTLGRALPFGFRAPSNPTSPYLGQMGRQMCGPSSPRGPPPWEPGLRLSFSHLHARFGGPWLFAPGCGAAPGHMGRLYGPVVVSGREEGWLGCSTHTNYSEPLFPWVPCRHDPPAHRYVNLL